jgi:hypothetical protein
MFQTPKQRITLVTVAVLLYLSDPLIEWHYLKMDLDRGAFPVNQDSIIIGLYRFVLGWLILSPLYAALLWFSMRKYPGKKPLFGFNSDRFYWSLIWSFAFALPVFYEVFSAAQRLHGEYPLEVISSLVFAYLLLCFRTSIVYRARQP